jgi:hypothetical protein
LFLKKPFRIFSFKDQIGKYFVFILSNNLLEICLDRSIIVSTKGANEALKMNQTISTNTIDNSGVMGSDEDIVITDVTRPQDSTQQIQQYEKWKQKIRIELVREQNEVRKKKCTMRKPILLRLLN